MIKIAVAVALSAFVVYDAAVPSSVSGTIAIQPQRVGKGDRLPTHPSNSTCVDAVSPFYRGECIRRTNPFKQTPEPSSVRIVTADRLQTKQDGPTAANRATSVSS